MRVPILSTLCLCFVFQITFGQQPSYVGSGNDDKINVSASDSHHAEGWVDAASSRRTVDGSGMLADYFDAVRFLTQATIGFDHEHVQEVLQSGKEKWIDDQLALNPTYVLPETRAIFDIIASNISPDDIPRRPKWRHFSYGWWSVNSSNEDLLRHKVACALAEIMVVSRNSDLGEYGDALSSYYDVLLKHAFGNYRDLLHEIALHPAMGFYLSHLNNPKTVDSIGQHPDENFAREIMQLFSIGLYELEEDGNHQIRNGASIPTYDNDDINQFARVFTGLGIGDVLPELDDPNATWDDEARFGMGLWVANVTIPMQMWDEDDPSTGWRDEDQHEDGAKYLLNDFVVPWEQPGLKDIQDAIENLYDHQNVGPFLAYRLIQRLVKSNPSTQYVERVAEAFDGAGTYGTTRGDLGAVVKAILMDPEAREASFQYDDKNSKLKEPLFRYTQFSRAVEKNSPSGYYWNVGYAFYEDTKQGILASPSVFNFFLPNDSPNGPIQEAGLVAPEYQLHDASTSVGYMNNVWRWTQSWGNIMNSWEDFTDTDVQWEISSLLPLATEPEAYINWLDKHLLGGNMSDETRVIIRKALKEFNPNIEWHNALENRVRIGMQLALISPDFCIMR